MRNLYARFILWLIRPALERESVIRAKSLPVILDEISAKIDRSTLRMAVQTQAVVGGPIYNTGVGKDFADRLSQVVRAEIARSVSAGCGEPTHA